MLSKKSDVGKLATKETVVNHQDSGSNLLQPLFYVCKRDTHKSTQATC